MSYRFMLDTNICFFESEKDKKKFAENVTSNWAFYVKEFEGEQEIMDYLNKRSSYHIFFKSPYCVCPYNIVEVFEGVNFQYPFVVTIRELLSEDILVARVNTDGTIEELYYKNDITDNEEEKDTIENENKNYKIFFLEQSLKKLAKLYIELVYGIKDIFVMFCEYDDNDVVVYYYPYENAMITGKIFISKHELLHFGE